VLGQSSDVPYWRLSYFYFFYFALLGAWLPYWPLYLSDLNFAADQIGYLAAAMMLSKIIAPSLWGWLAKRSGRRMAVIRGGSLAALLIFLGVFVDQSFAWLASVIFAYSFFWNAVMPQFEVVTLSHLAGRYERYSQIRVWGSVGFICAVAGLGWVFDHLAITWLPWLLALVLAGIWFSSLTVAEKPQAKPHASERVPLSSLLKHPSVLAFFAVCFLLQVSHGPYYTFFSVYLEQYGYTRAAIGMLWSLGVVAEVVVFLLMHRLLLSMGLRLLLLLSLALSALRWALTGFYADQLPVLLFAQCLHAASFGTFHAFAVEMVRRFFGVDHQGQGMALYSGVSFGLGGALGAVLSGWMWALSPTASFVMASMACVLALAVALLINTRLRLSA
jgi:PPP family 3-phenylpropionic acid transporter